LIFRLTTSAKATVVKKAETTESEKAQTSICAETDLPPDHLRQSYGGQEGGSYGLEKRTDRVSSA
jgi:hypothetical protein